MKMTRRFLACVLSLAMMVSCFGISAYAATPSDDLTTSNFTLAITPSDSTLSVALNCNKQVTAWGAGSGIMRITDDSGADASTYFTLNSIDTVIGDKNDSVSLAKWSSTANDPNNGDTVDAGTWTTYVYTVSEDIPEGAYTFTMTFVNGDCYDGVNMDDYSCSGQSITGTYSVSGSSSTNPYTASISADKTEVKVDEAVTVTVNVGGTTGSFASSEVTLTYDTKYLTFDADSQTGLNGAGVTNTNGTIKIVDHGTTQNNGTAYQLTFTGNAPTAANTAVTLISAGFDEAANVAVENLIPAAITQETVSVAVKNADLNVTLSDDFNGYETVPYGGTYTFTAKDPNYNYEITVNDGTITPSYDATTGMWTITNVTTDLTITATKTAKTFNVTISDMDAISGTPPTGDNAATYKVNYTFTLKNNVAAEGGTNGTSYTVESITIGGQEVTNSYRVDGRVYTIDGDYITGDIVITTKVETVTPGSYTVTMDQSVSELKTDKTVVESGGTVTLTLTPVTGYKYEIRVNGVVKSLDTDNRIVITNVTENLIVSVDKTLDLTENNVSVKVYLELDGKTVYLVQVTTKLDDGNVYTYGGQNMYWSAKYNSDNGANAFLVIMDNKDADGEEQVLTLEAAIAEIDISTGTAATIDYSGNVNMADASTVDANDAQLVYNMYQTKYYSAFTTNVTMEKFLRADMNASGDISVEDATVIVNAILNGTANSTT